MSFGQPFSFGMGAKSAAGEASALSSQTAPFGADTLASAGAFQIVLDNGNPATGLTDLGTGTASGYTFDGAAGTIVSASNGGLSAQDGNTINVRRVSDGSEATITLDVIANAYSASTMAEATAAQQDGSLALGDQVLLRGGTYNSARAATGPRRTTLPSGTWTGSNWVVVKPHDGEAVEFKRLQVNGDLGGCQYLSYEGLTFDTYNGGVSMNGVLEFKGGANTCRAKDCTFTASVTQSETSAGEDCERAIHGDAQAVALQLIDNTFTDVFDGYVGPGQNAVIRGNIVRTFWNDGVKFIPPANDVLVEGHTSTDAKHVYRTHTITGMTAGNPTTITVSDATGITVGNDCRAIGFTGFDGLDDDIYNISAISGNDLTVDVDTTGSSAYISGGTLQQSGTHGDHIQGSFSGISAGEADDMTFRALSLTRGNGTPGWRDKQGLFLTDAGAVNINRLRVEGMIYAGTLTGGIACSNPVDCEVASSVVVGIPDVVTGSNTPTVNLGSGATVFDTLANSITGGCTESNCDDTIALTQAGLEAAFDSPQIDTEESVTAATAYATKSGSAGDTASPKRGATPYQSFANPYAFTDPRTGITLADSLTVTGEGNIGTIDISALDVAEDDVVLLAVYASTSTTRNLVVASAGWTEITDTSLSGGTTRAQLMASWKRMGATPDTSISITEAVTWQEGAAAEVRVYRGVNTTTALDVESVVTSDADTMLPDPGAITPTTTGAKVAVFGCGAYATEAAATLTSSGLSNTLSTNDLANSGFAYNVVAHSGDVDWTSGAVDIAQFGVSGVTDSADYASVSLVVVLRPA